MKDIDGRVRGALLPDTELAHQDGRRDEIRAIMTLRDATLRDRGMRDHVSVIPSQAGPRNRTPPIRTFFARWGLALERTVLAAGDKAGPSTTQFAEFLSEWRQCSRNVPTLEAWLSRHHMKWAARVPEKPFAARSGRRMHKACKGGRQHIPAGRWSLSAGIFFAYWSRKERILRLRLGCLSLRSAFASI
ncbi:hypothetical protein SPHINGO361_120195 [Sphingomonas sp. EC-HK361]|nr:hypothetical protein SPHINGO361_120195 [Sphingomonas sp. EC-HK361]